MTSQAKVLLLGADGFIGRHLAFGLRNSGLHVVCVAKSTKALSGMGFETLAVDFTMKLFQTPEFWHQHLLDVDYVVNAAGLLNGTNDAFHGVHVAAPKAIYSAMRPTAKGVLISAVGLNTPTRFSKFRLDGETEALAAKITVLRCGLVLGDTAFGGSALIRALAANPLFVPVPSGKAPLFNPIHVEDLTSIVAETLLLPSQSNPMDIGGPETIDLRTMVGRYRSWLGLGKARFLALPGPVMALLGSVGDLCKMGPISRTSLAQMKSGVLANTDDMTASIKFKPRAFSIFTQTRPAGTGDLWHARLYLLTPLLRLTLAFLWITSGLIGLLLPPDMYLPLLQAPYFSDMNLILLARTGGLVDLAIAVALLRNWSPKRTAYIQIAMVLGYTLAFTVLAPTLWLLPLGGLLKNIPILVMLLFHLVLTKER